MSHFFAIRKLMPVKTFAISFRFVEFFKSVNFRGGNPVFAIRVGSSLFPQHEKFTCILGVGHEIQLAKQFGSETLKSAGAVIGSTILHYRVPILLKKGE